MPEQRNGTKIDIAVIDEMEKVKENQECIDLSFEELSYALEHSNDVADVMVFEFDKDTGILEAEYRNENDGEVVWIKKFRLVEVKD